MSGETGTSFSKEELSNRADVFIKRYMAGFINMAIYWPFAVQSPELGGLVASIGVSGDLTKVHYVPMSAIRATLKPEYRERFDGWQGGLQVGLPELGFVLLIVFPNGQNVVQLVKPTAEDMGTARRIHQEGSSADSPFTAFGLSAGDVSGIVQ